MTPEHDRKDLSPFPFGDGKAGKRAREILLYNPLCYHCKTKKAVMTLDYDVSADLEQIQCCQDCEPEIIEIVTRDLLKIGANPYDTFGRNGMGRA